MTFCWKWISLEISEYTAATMSSCIKHEISTLAANNIQVSGIACSYCELMRNAISSELLKKQVILHNTPYISPPNIDFCRDDYNGNDPLHNRSF